MSAAQQFVDAQGTRLSTTSAGAILLPIAFACTAAALVIGGAATLLAAAALSLLFVGVLTSWLHVRGLRLKPLAPIERSVAEGFPLRVGTHNTARMLPACAVTLRAETGAGKYGVLPFLAPGESATVEVPHRFQVRGSLKSIEVRVGSSFPFGLIRCERRFTVPADCLALPRPLAREDMRLMPSIKHDGPHRIPTRQDGDDELWAPREWREGESLRRVHWKLSARRDRLIVSDFRSHEDGPLEVVLVTQVASLGRTLRHSAFERAVSVTAALCERALREKREVNLHILDSPHTPSATLRGRAGRMTALRSLALAKPKQGDPTASGSKEVRLAIANGLPLVCILASGQSKPHTELQRNSSVHWVDVESQKFQHVALHAGDSQ